jgi:hypothetical protein
MTHAHVRRRLSEYLEAELSPREEASLEAHLAECAGCAAELRALRRALDLLHGLPAPEPARDLGAAVIARLRAGEARPARWTWPLFRLFGEEAWLGGLAPVAAALGVGAIAWLLTPDLLPGAAPAELAQLPGYEASPPARQAAASAPGAITLLAGSKLAPARGAASLPKIQTCLERARVGDPTTDECAAWYSWFVAKALEDAGGFADEVDQLPAKSREPWLRRVSDFAQRSGSAHLVGAQLRSSHHPGAVRFAKRFERGGGLVQQAGWTGR